MDWRQSRTDFTIYFDFEVEQILGTIGLLKGTVVQWTGPAQDGDSGFLLTYCSNILSRYLGLGNDLILTPESLYRRLLKSGGEVVFTWKDTKDE